MFQQSRLIPDDSVVFDEKHVLIRQESSAIELGNYEEWLVLYVDDELSSEERNRVENFLAVHPHLQQELALFRQTKLQPGEITFPDKNVLFRTQTATIFRLQWWKVAVAAVLILAAGLTTYSVLHKTNSNPADNLAGTPKGQLRVEQNKKASEQRENVAAKQPENEQMGVAAPGKTNKVKIGEKGAHKKTTPLPSFATNNGQVQGTIERRPVVDYLANDTKVAEPQIKDALGPGKILKENFKATVVTNNPSQTPEPIYAVDNSERSDNKKLRGFFRKATRLIEHTTRINPADDDNRVLIGGMAINLK